MMNAPTSTTTSITIPETADRTRLRRETGARLRAAMAAQGVDALILLEDTSVMYATGTSWPLGEAGLTHIECPVAVVVVGDDLPHLFLPFREGVAQETELPADHLHGPVYPEFDEGIANFARMLADIIPSGASIAVDQYTGAMRRAQATLFPSGPPTDAVLVLSAAKLIKTQDELACMRTSIRITDAAMVDVQAALEPGIRQIDLSAAFVRRAFELGATANVLDSIWQIMPRSRAEGTWTVHDDLALPLLTTERELRRGDVLWTDVSITYGGYCSDFGRTWIVGQDPTPAQQRQFTRWRGILDAVLAVTRAGATLAELGQVAIDANDGRKPWLPHFYLGHGIGVGPAEMPMIGTDLGAEFDKNYTLEPGMVLVLEPLVWEDGTGGYRAEEIFVITEEGHIKLTNYPYTPYGD